MNLRQNTDEEFEGTEKSGLELELTADCAPRQRATTVKFPPQKHDTLITEDDVSKAETEVMEDAFQGKDVVKYSKPMKSVVIASTNSVIESRLSNPPIETPTKEVPGLGFTTFNGEAFAQVTSSNKKLSNLEVNKIGSYDLDSQGHQIQKGMHHEKVPSLTSGEISEYVLPNSAARMDYSSKEKPMRFTAYQD